MVLGDGGGYESDPENLSPAGSDDEIGWSPTAGRKLNERERIALAGSAPPSAHHEEDDVDERVYEGGAGSSEAVSRAVALPTTVSFELTSGEALCARFSPQGEYFAIGYTSGALSVHSTTSGKQVFQVACEQDQDTPSPVTALRYRDTLALETKNVVMFATGDGKLRFWHSTSGNFLGAPIVEENNQIFAVDTPLLGDQIATAGLDCNVRVYDVATRKLVHTLAGGSGASGGHTNRVFALKYVDENPAVLISGGWDNTVQFWDVRAGQSVRSLYGPSVCGDALDVSDGTIVTGSHRRFRALQAWDFGSGRLLYDIPWLPSKDEDPCFIYSAKMGRSRMKGMVVAGGSESNEARLVNVNKDGALAGRLPKLSSTVNAVDFNKSEDLLAVLCKDSCHFVDLRSQPKRKM
ncbi:hypothetical protein CYMTET_12397 [Cymbomonas tetramitiformis]|uniref:Anaphase-promoting complex subunit 4 WD40 domain-containing protein n=1 Tax=Cymbomonas tetramitiformis TaxID=36881 RepID=A0AAE0GLS1_9CHLO|nr:hypothetical protein CYMTET_12397 [Cymbomonas tetramitiformis]|eukprot:gene19225-22983_t